MIFNAVRRLAWTVMVAVGAPIGLTAQVEIHTKAAELTLTGRVHAQFNTTSVTDAFASEFLIRRARFTAAVKVNDFVEGRVQPDFGEGEIKLRDAYVRLNFDRSFRMTFGQFKRPFDLFELTSSTQTLVIERTGGIRGLNACTGPGGICSLSRLTEKLGFSDRDIGFMVDGTEGIVSYQVAVTNGAGANTEDENGAKSYGSRIAVTPTGNVHIAGNIGIHDYANPVTSDDEYAVAFGADVDVGDFSEGIHVRLGAVAGENWLNLDPTGNPTTFATAQGIVSFRKPVTNHRFIDAVEPVGRISWGDPDTDTPDDAGILLTPGFTLHFSGRNKLAANVDVWVPNDGDAEWSFKFQSYLHF